MSRNRLELTERQICNHICYQSLYYTDNPLNNFPNPNKMKKSHLSVTGVMIAVFTLNVFALNVYVAFAASFPDVSEFNLNGDAISYVKDNGIVSGYPDGSFKPYNTINRAEFTKIIIGAKYEATEIDGCVAENSTSGMTNMFFPDVPKNEWFAKYICVAKIHDVISGYPDGTFKPADTINFAEAAKIISNTFGYPADVDAVWYKPYTDNLADKNAIPTTIMGFDYLITRGEMSEMVYRLKADITSKTSWNYAAMNQPISLNVYFSTTRNNPGMQDCAKTDLVTRSVPHTGATAAAALDQLFRGPTTEEKALGMNDFWITEETAHNLKRVFIKNGIAYLDWKDIRTVIPNASTSCGSASFFAPVEATLEQFPTVTKVIQAIDGNPSDFYEWMQIGCSAENNNCDATPYGTTQMPTSCTDEVEGLPVITSISSTSGSVGTVVTIKGCNFSGFEGDKNAWIVNEEGVKGILYGETGSTSNQIIFTLKTPLCQIDTSYSGLPCDAELSLTPGTYQIYVSPWGTASNEAAFVIE